jgi:hypothetical protein
MSSESIDGDISTPIWKWEEEEEPEDVSNLDSTETSSS